MAASGAPLVNPSEKTWGESFKTTYAAACLKHDTLLRLPDPVLDELAGKLDSSQQAFESAISTLARAFIFLLVLAYPWLRGVDPWVAQHQKVLEQWIAAAIGPVGNPDWEYLVVLVVVPVGWLVLMWSPLRKNPHASILLLRSRPEKASLWSTWNIAFSLFMILVLVGAGEALYYLRTMTTNAMLAAGIVWFVPLAFVTLVCIPALYVFFQIVWVIVSGLERNAGVQLLAQEFLRLLRRLDNITDLASLTRSERKTVVEAIVAISRTMSRLSDPRPDSATAWATREMHLASQNVLCLASWIYIPQAGTLAALKDQMIRYANILLSGNLDELPRGEVGEMQGLRIVEREIVGWRRALLHLGMVLYFVLPLAAAALAITMFHWESRVTAPMQVIAGLAYLIWVLAGLISFLRYLGPDARTLVTDVFKAFVGKK